MKSNETQRNDREFIIGKANPTTRRMQTKKQQKSASSKTKTNMKRVRDIGFVFHEMVFLVKMSKNCVFRLRRASSKTKENKKVRKFKNKKKHDTCVWDIGFCVSRNGVFFFIMLKKTLRMSTAACNVLLFQIPVQRQKIRKFENQKKHETCLGHWLCVS